ncbi:MAG: nuclear transport factor 2 family protein [Candidatus Obscuribacterales bacterium]|nr:nuclear transport factor 2 family protein [Candidatus Obscuribacterales bacterium]
MQPRKTLKVALLSLSTLLLAQCPAVLAADSTQDASASVSSGSSDAEQMKKDLEKLLVSFEHDWNSHNLDAVMAYYADDYYNNDGFDKKTIQQLTQELWKAYPDIKSTSLTKQIRVEGPYATVESKDEATGNTAEEMVGLGTKGELKSTSEGQLYLKHLGTRWRIIGDRIDFEKITVGYGLARQLQPIFAAPEQVKGGKQFTARLEVDLPTGLAASGAISQATVSFPLSKRIPDKYKPIGDAITDRPLLERVMVANTKNRNELLTASIGLTNASGNSLMGALTLTRRLNVIPTMEAEEVTTTAVEPSKTPKTDEQAAPVTK